MTAPTHAGPIAANARALAPDLSRGVMLLFIALANSHYFLPGHSPVGGSAVFGGFPTDLGRIDRVVAWTISTFVDGRAYPMFGLLFGYGVARIAWVQPGPGSQVRRLLWRRSGVLIVVGFLHAMLLFVGDILAAYGVLLLVGAWAVNWKDRSLWIVATLFFIVVALPGDGAMSVSTAPPDASMLSPDLLTQFAERITVQPLIALFAPLGFACPFLIGLWAGRRQVLEQPERHRRLLGATAIVGIGVAAVGAQPVALVVAQVIPRPGDQALAYLGPIHDAAGILGGFGYAALIALVALWLAPPGRERRFGRRTAAVTRALAATGERSMTCYLAQSVVWFVVFTPYLLGLAGELTVTTTALLAIATWLTTVVLADRMRAAGERGPFERLTRRVTYGAPKSAGPPPSPSPSSSHSAPAS